jgi:signal transduction histidine kinase
MEERQIQLHNHISHIPNKVLADSIRLKQVLLNILSNAVKYNSYNGSITLHQEIIDNQHLRISIMDSGEGLTDEDISKLFIPFERLNKNTNIEGTGIGLVLSKNLMELMNGTIGIESTVGKGSTFWVKLQLSDTIA